MSLATRCTSCGTVFRVVQDQLKVSDGWVRCGRCDAVFNAAEGLFDLEREAPPPWSPTQPPVEAFDTAPAPAADDGPGRTSTHAVPDVPHVSSPAPAAIEAVRAAPAAIPADLVSAAMARHADDTGTAHDRAASFEPDAPDVGPPDDAPAETASRFEWRPERDRRATALLAGAALLLAAGLAAQAAAQFSDVTAARWPALRPALAQWCGLAGCSLAAPRRIEDIVVDSSALAPVIGTDALKLGIALRNQAGFAVAVPSVDLSLTDSAGRLLARRTLHPADFRVAAPSLAAGGELPLQALVTAGAAPVTGYTVEIFYP